MNEENTFNMTENLNLLLTHLKEIEQNYESLKETLHQVLELMLNTVSSPQAINSLLNDRKVHEEFVSFSNDTIDLCENDNTSENINQLINIVYICKSAIPISKEEGKEIV